MENKDNVNDLLNALDNDLAILDELIRLSKEREEIRKLKNRFEGDIAIASDLLSEGNSEVAEKYLEMRYAVDE